MPTVNDGVPEGTETLTLGAATAANVSVVQGTGTILDGAVPSLSISGTADVNEAIGKVTYTVTLSSAAVAPVTVSYGTQDGTATSGQRLHGHQWQPQLRARRAHKNLHGRHQQRHRI